MAFQTSILVNGNWISRTESADAALRFYNQKDEEAITNTAEVEEAPRFGILSQTVIRNPLVNWIFPARLRTSRTQDVAFIGDDFVQIKELRSDGLLWDVIHKEDFGARIRNARVFGTISEENDPADNKLGPIPMIDENGDFIMNSDEVPRKPSVFLPQQLILLQLDTGDSVFLSLLTSPQGKLYFGSSSYRVSKPMLKLQPGMHLSVDPSSRYMAIACSEGMFVIYALHSREALKAQASTRPPTEIRYVESERYVHFNGVIHKMEFLFPTPGDEKHVILLLLVVDRGRTRMVVYEWVTGVDLARIRPHGQKGHVLEQSRRMPLLLIPLKIRSSFILICENSMTVCQDILQRSPTFIEFNSTIDPQTEYHHGSGIPLWTAWTRPVRYKEFPRDDIYIIREDGAVGFLEVDPDEEELVKSYNNIGQLGANCGRALAALDYDPSARSVEPRSGDLLVTGGSSCPGGSYLSSAREFPFFIQPIQNWSPSQDFATTYPAQDRDSMEEPLPSRSNSKVVHKPDRIFACVGKGSRGAITELRYGLEANIGLEMDYDMPVMETWVLSPSPGSAEEYGGILFLLSVGDRSAVLQLSDDASNISELGEESTSFDLRYRTIAAAMHGKHIIQVTEKSIALVCGSYVQIHEREEILTVLDGENSTQAGGLIADASIGENSVVYTTRVDHAIYLQVMDITSTPFIGMDVDSGKYPVPSTSFRTLSRLPSEVTSLAIGMVHQTPCAIVAIREDNSIALIFQPVAGGNQKLLKVPSIYGAQVVHLEAIVSIAMVLGQHKNLVILCGTRNGVLLTLEIDENTLEIMNSRHDRVGASTVMVSRDQYSITNDLFFATCDSKIYAIVPNMSHTAGIESLPNRWLGSLKIHQIWLTDTLNPGLPQPEVNSLARLRPTPAGTDGGLLVAAGPQLLLAGLSIQPKAVPRHIVIGGTPTRLMYSSALEVLVVAACVKGKSTILFIDPNTGADLSQPIDQKTNSPVEFVSGLGNTNERIFRLCEWSYTKDGKTWNFIIVSTNTGRLLILSVDQAQIRESLNNAGTPRSKISYYTRHRFKCKEPIYCVTGFTEGILWSAGSQLFCDTLDLKEKRFKNMAKIDLPSAATNLSFDNGIIYALTTCHSLEVLRLVSNDGQYEILRTHGDQLARYTLHNTIVDRLSDRPIHLISDKLCSIAGLWPTQETKADTLQPIFEAQLPYSILKFRFGRCRPLWDPVWNQVYNRPTADEASSTSLEAIPSMLSHSETLGLSITGSLSHFTFLDLSSWRFLRLIMDMAIRSRKICEVTTKDDSIPLEQAMEPLVMMHINGDILKRVIYERKLEELLRIGEQSLMAGLLHKKFRELLYELHQGKLAEDASAEMYISQGYADLEFFLRPVL